MDLAFLCVANIVLWSALLAAIIVCLRNAHRKDPRQSESGSNLSEMRHTKQCPAGTHFEDGYLIKEKHK